MRTVTVYDEAGRERLRCMFDDLKVSMDFADALPLEIAVNGETFRWGRITDDETYDNGVRSVYSKTPGSDWWGDPDEPGSPLVADMRHALVSADLSEDDSCARWALEDYIQGWIARLSGDTAFAETEGEGSGRWGR